MQALIIPGEIKGTLRMPASKSHTQRLLALSLLHQGITRISGSGKSDDEETAKNIIQKAGAKVRKLENDIIEIQSAGRPSLHESIDCGESALCLRMFAPILTLSADAFEMNGRGTLLKRPVQQFERFLPGLSVKVNTTDGYLPVRLQGPLKPTDITIDGSESSQYLTGLLIAFSSACSEPVTIKVHDPVSKPYTDLTLQLLEKFGYSFRREGYASYTLLPVSSSNEVITCRVEGDWSHAAFWLVAGAIAGDIELNGLNLNSYQGDKVILDVMRQAGIILQICDDKILVERCLNIKAFELDATDHPDLFPPLAVLAAAANGRSAIKGVSRLIHKESDRADLINRMLTALGIRSEVKDDILFIEGGIIRGGVVETAHDHRMVMAASIAGLAASGAVTVKAAGAVTKSYPDFFEDLRSLGAVVSLSPETFLA